MRTYGKSYKEIILEKIVIAERNLVAQEYGSERYLIIKDHIARLRMCISPYQRMIRRKSVDNRVQVHHEKW